MYIWKFVSTRVSPKVYEQLSHAEYLKLERAISNIQLRHDMMCVCDNGNKAAEVFKAELDSLFFSLAPKYMEVTMYRAEIKGSGLAYNFESVKYVY